MITKVSDWEEFPSYYEVLCAISEFLSGRYRKDLIVKRDSLPAGQKWEYFNFSAFDFCAVVVLAIIWTVLRNLTEGIIFKPLGHHCGLTPTNQKKMPESAWKFLYYLSAWSCNCYILIFSGDYQFFQKPATVWADWSLTEPIPMKMYILYVAQCGFYLHSMFATVYMDVWRKDSYVMLFHHLSTLLLISFSFAVRCHNIGIFVLFFHDICDIFLEFSKLNVYFKEQNNKLVVIHDILANASFLCFTVAWYIARLYWYPLRVLYTAMSNVPYSLLMNCLLWILQILNVYWFILIIQVLIRVVSGNFKEGDDVREYDVQERWKREKEQAERNKQRKNTEINGNVKEAVVMAYSETTCNM